MEEREGKWGRREGRAGGEAVPSIDLVWRINFRLDHPSHAHIWQSSKFAAYTIPLPHLPQPPRDYLYSC